MTPKCARTHIVDINVGDMVACASVGKANHAEVVAVPRNLVAKIPKFKL